MVLDQSNFIAEFITAAAEKTNEEVDGLKRSLIFALLNIKDTPHYENICRSDDSTNGVDLFYVLLKPVAHGCISDWEVLVIVDIYFLNLNF